MDTGGWAPWNAAMAETSAEMGFGAALRAWRQARGLSQLDLALAAGASPRHLSFLETNRAKPSRDMVLALADAMVIPRASRNALLNAAGFAPLYPTTPLDDAALEPLRRILAEMMERHAPNPAILCDRHWRIIDANPTARVLLAPLQREGDGANMLRMLATSPAAPEVIGNYVEVLDEMIGRVRLDVLEAGGDPVLSELLQMLEKALALRASSRSPQVRRPLVPLTLRTPGGELRFLSAITHFATSEDIAVRDLRLELLFPADDQTRKALGAMA